MRLFQASAPLPLPACLVCDALHSQALQHLITLLVVCRLWQSYARDVPYNGTRFIFAGVLGLLFGLILWNCGHKSKRHSSA